MGKVFMNKVKVTIAGIVLLLLLAIITIGKTIYEDKRALPAMPLHVVFQGEYKTKDGAWQPIVTGEHIPVGEETVILRGTLQKAFPDGEIIEPLNNGEAIVLYFDHIGARVYMDGKQVHAFDSEHPQLGNAACGKYWCMYRYAGGSGETIEIHFENPHRYGNELAIDKFLSSMYMYIGTDFEIMMSKQTELEKLLGASIIVLSVIVAGIGLFSSLVRLQQSKFLWLIGATGLFAGIYLMVNASNVYMWNANIALNTVLYVLSIALYAFFFQLFTQQCLTDPLRTIAFWLVLASGLGTGVLLLVAVIFDLKIYDMLWVWGRFESVISIGLVGCCSIEIKRSKRTVRGMYVAFSVVLAALTLDIIATGFGWWQGAYCSLIVFAAVFVMGLFVALRVIPESIRATMREKEIQAELEKNKTALMLSQIQPHFLYNSLGAIRELCRQNPEDARNALGTFITYLRGNMESIQREHLVGFEKELAHISTYLELEKLRFGDELTVAYDIQETDFLLPSLTIQPLVENAVKHGVCSREEGGTVVLHTHREGDRVVIMIRDDGMGFDSMETVGSDHIGLRNVRDRLKYIVDGQLEIVSIPEVGTTVTVTIHDRKE